ncbi:MAG: hypothetical protein UT67_C0007G0012 [Candidatus Magasanikbacteria bacterium GW2011_GWA2_40_10]|uniref:Rod shape-determining protein MreD n=1 Tax=Candidatus Magasanikbacteria bacterium GW2011_GWA2_40_10 TaxID=1619037 RepID=A0A0G0Q3S7_9BACT|nr:MAG: hypothetical protein UT67_C0007G0012 [Candidatus Magasanikbacteria bacterium GW2011_GWA2_40_10]
MKLLWRILALFFTILLIISAHIFVVNFLPYPFSHINTTIFLLLLLLTIGAEKKSIWLGLIVSYFLELFSGIPFGIGMSATIITLLAINWFQLNILTNRSAYMMFLSLLLGITLYRTVFIIFLTVYNYFLRQQTLSYKEIIIDAGWEISLSSVVLFLIYFVGSEFFKRLNPGYAKSIRIYG